MQDPVLLSLCQDLGAQVPGDDSAAGLPHVVIMSAPFNRFNLQIAVHLYVYLKS